MDQTVLGSWIDVIGPDGREHPLTIKCLKFMAENALEKNIAINLARPGIKRFLDRPQLLEVRKEPLAIVAGGPSLARTLDRVRDFEHVLVCGSAHDHVSKAGVKMTYAVVVDGVPTMVDCLKHPQKNCTYLLASQLDPSCFDALEGYPIEMWHFRDQVTESNFNGEKPICYGVSCTINAVQMALFMGYQHYHFFGFDCCFDSKDETHAYKMDDEIEVEDQIVHVGDEKVALRTNMGLMMQAVNFIQIVRSEDGNFFHSTIHGGGLIAEMVRQGNDELRKRVALAD